MIQVRRGGRSFGGGMRRRSFGGGNRSRSFGGRSRPAPRAPARPPQRAPV